MLTLVKREQQWLKEFLKTHSVDAILSDNRFGLHAPGIPSIFITHQLQIKTGMGGLLNALARQVNNRYLRKFNECWVPDFRGPDSLAGELSNSAAQTKIMIKHIGALSRFEVCTNDTNETDVLILLSGPEPQRTLLENNMIAEFSRFRGKAVMVRGLPAGHELPSVPSNVQVYNHVPAIRLNEMICSAKMVVARCGYTTVMDLVKLKKRSILIPTPGQAEQEYLAKHLLARQLAYTVSQNKFSLERSLQDAEDFTFRKMELSMEAYKPVLEEFVRRLKQEIAHKKTG